MGTIKINVPAVLNAGSQAKKAKKTVTTANQNIRSIKNRIDPKVINKGDLSAKFRNIDSQLKSVSQKIDRITLLRIAAPINITARNSGLGAQCLLLR